MKAIISYILISLLFVSLQAQTPEELAKKREAEMKAYQKQQQEGIKALEADFQKYQDERDKAFSDYLKKRWTEFQVYSGVDLPDSPKPPVPPQYEPADDGDGIHLKIDPQDVPPQKEPIPSEPIIDIIPDVKVTPVPGKEIETIKFNFFGANIIVQTDKNLMLPFESEISENSFADYWDSITSSDYLNVINQLSNSANQLKLNDWGFYILVDNYSDKIHSDDKVSSQLLSWILLLKSGYKVKIGYSGNQVSLMLPAIQQVYNYKFASLEGINFYMTQNLNSIIYTYEQDFEGATKTFNLDFYEPLEFPNQKKYRALRFEYGGKEYNISIAYNQNTVEFYDIYPPVDIEHYFNTPVSNQIASSLLNQFDQILEAHSDEDKANILLTFIHQAFPYKTDDEQFGKEKYFYVEDIFSFSYCDCEDRSVLYSYLIRNLIGISTIGINAPGHVFTAVEFDKIIGDNIEYEDRIYTICDPTYIGAKVGKGMPDMISQKLTVVPVR